uniref:Uncharacterized protein n=1 Tax=Setaria viridis TaxID=4556 RepID=A0A4U6U605_SETVI|nr:hypothetical protein SEVIR_6G162833v2 [Setaria viridis]
MVVLMILSQVMQLLPQACCLPLPNQKGSYEVHSYRDLP